MGVFPYTEGGRVGNFEKIGGGEWFMRGFWWVDEQSRMYAPGRAALGDRGVGGGWGSGDDLLLDGWGIDTSAQPVGGAAHGV